MKTDFNAHLRSAGSVIAASALLLGTCAWANEVNVLTAWYGQSCGAAHGNVTAHVKSRCDGRQVCLYGVDAPSLGDPAPGCAKNLIVVFACQGQTAVRLSQLQAEANGRTLVLACNTPESH